MESITPAELANILMDSTPIEMKIDACMAITIVSQMQLALRHPGNINQSADLAIDAAKQIQRSLGRINPKISEFLEQGWNPDFDMTDEESDRFINNELTVIDVHNVYTLFELDEYGNEVKEKFLSITTRPQDWGNKDRWHYHTCTIRFEQNGTRYINHCHVWQEMERSTFEALEAISSALFHVYRPGTPIELCDRSHLHRDDFWIEEWGEMPPYYEFEDDFGFEI
jgi:hypothetical protein